MIYFIINSYAITMFPLLNRLFDIFRLKAVTLFIIDHLNIITRMNEKVFFEINF